MRDRTPFFLSEVVMSLFPAGADGLALTTVPLWAGALANRFQARMEFDTVKVQASGAAYAREFHVDEDHLLQISRTWIIRRSSPVDFVPGRNQEYALDLVWFDYHAGLWHQRTYLGVTARSVDWTSQGTNQFLADQAWRAQRFIQAGGSIDGIVTTPLPAPADEEQSIPFFREDPLLVGGYLLGHYRWPVAVTLTSAKVIGWAPQVTPTVLELEIDGALTGRQITIPVGTANTDVSAILDLGNQPVAALQSVRWKVISGPDPENAAWNVALTMQVEVV